MIIYYTARDQTGAKISAKIEAINMKEARATLFQMKLTPIAVSIYPVFSFTERLNALIARLGSGVSLDELIVFNRQFQTLYVTGFPILRGLTLIEEQTENMYFRGILGKIVADLGAGASLETAFGKHPSVFDATYISLLRSGEASGKLDQVLDRLANLGEQRLENQERVKSALLYPKIVIATLIVAALVIVYFVLPKLKMFFDQFGAQLPLATRALLGISDFMVHWWYVVLIIGVGGTYGLRRYLSTPKGKVLYHRGQLRTPVFGALIKEIETNNFCAVLEILLAGGVPIVDGLKLVASSMTNEIFRQEVRTYSQRVEKGGSLAAGLLESRIFPRMMASLVGVGEESGAIESVLQRISKYYQMRVNYRTANLSKTLEPIMLGIIFFAVLFLALAVFMPIWKMAGLVRR